MNKIAVVTDSTADLPEEILKQYEIAVAPMIVNFDKVKYRDGVNLKPDEFYKRLRKSETFPTTSSGITGEFLEIFESLKGKVDGVVVVALSTLIPGISVQSANAAKEMVPELKIEVIDSLLACTGEGFGALEAARMAQKGGSMEQVLARAKEVLAKAHVFWYVDDIEYMRRGGRLNLLRYDITDLQKAKPVMEIQGGKFMPVAMPPTTEEALDTLLDCMKKNTTGAPVHVSIEHADNLEAAETLKKAITSKYKVAEFFMVGFTPVIGSHFGPGATGISFYSE
jgi:DegV family protein with EDD domain